MRPWRDARDIVTQTAERRGTGNLLVAGSIASAETVAETIPYSLHARGWSAVSLGRD